VIDVNGASQPRENRTSATAVIHVNDSYAEVRDLTLTFLEDFSHSAVPPATCVRNFSDSCAGKAAELDDIADNRNRYVIQSSSFSFGTVTFNPDRTYADITAPCQFTSLQIKDTLGNPTNLVVTVKGTCILTAVYEQWHWWLCDSHFRETVAPFNSGFRF
jgi:hypothetical protein